MLGSGAIVVMDETTDAVKACLRRRALLRPGVLRQVHPVPRGHHLAGEDPAAHPRRLRPPERPRPADGRLRQHLAGHRLAAQADDHLPARSVGRRRPSPRPSTASAPEFEAHIATGRARSRPVRAARRRWQGHRPMPEPDAPPVDGVAVEIDGTEVVARKGELLIDAAERTGTYIPRFCYHHADAARSACAACASSRSTPGGARRCSRAACSSARPGMKVDTTRPVTKKAQDGVLEFLLINHPLDCPVCDKGGECPLQDQTMAYGPGESRFVEEKRHKEKPIPISDLVLLDRERCILCDRCTRFANEVAGDPLIHFMQPGQRHRGQHLPRRAVRLVLQRQHRADLPGGRPHRDAPTGSRPARGTSTPVESTCHGLLGRLPDRHRLLPRPGRCASSASTSTRSTGAGSATRAASASRPSTLRGPPGRAAGARGRRAGPGRLGRRPAPGRPRPCARRRGPTAVGVVGGARLTNEDAYAWAKLAKGVHRHRQRRRPARRRPARRARARPAPRHHRRGLRPGRHGPAARARPQGGAAGPVPAAAPRGDQGRRHRRRGVAPRDRALSGLAAASLQPRPGEAGSWCGRCVAATDADTRRRRGRRGAVNRARGPARPVRRPAHGRARPALARRVGRPARRRRRRAASPPEPDARFLPGAAPGQRQRRPRHGPGPGAAARAGSSLDEGRDWFAERWPAGARRRRARHPGHPAGRRRRAHRRAGAARGRPARRLPRPRPRRAGARRRPHRDRRRHVPQRLVAARPTWCWPPPASPRTAGTTTNIEGRVSALHQRVTPPGTARADWIVAAELALRLGADLGFAVASRPLGRDRAGRHRRYTGVTYRACSTPTPDGLVVPLGSEPDEPDAGRPQVGRRCRRRRGRGRGRRRRRGALRRRGRGRAAEGEADPAAEEATRPAATSRPRRAARRPPPRR